MLRQKWPKRNKRNWSFKNSSKKRKRNLRNRNKRRRKRELLLSRASKSRLKTQLSKIKPLKINS